MAENEKVYVMSTPEPPSWIRETLDREMEQFAEDLKTYLFGPAWSRRDPNPFPHMVLLPRVHRLEQWAHRTRLHIIRRRRDLRDAWDVARHGLPDHDDW